VKPLVAAAMTMLVVAASAGATISVAPDLAPPGSSVQVTGTGFSPSEAVDLFLDRADASVVLADASGSVAVDATLRYGWSIGTHWATLLGRTSGTSAQIAIEVGDPQANAWPQSGAVPEQTGFAVTESLLTAANVRRLGLAWGTGSADAIGQVEGGPVASGTLVYVVRDSSRRSTQNLDALRTDGSVAWSQPIVGTGANARIQGWWGTPLALGAGVVVVQTFRADATAARVLQAFDAATGEPRWRTTVPCPTCVDTRRDDWLIGWGSATVDGATLYLPVNLWSPSGVPAGFGQVCALDLATGSVAWCREIDDPTNVAVSGERIVVGSETRNRILALDAATGAMLWTVDLPASAAWNAITAGPAVVGDLVLVSDWERLHALRLRDGTAAWSWPHEGTMSFATDGQTIYVADEAVGDPWWCEGAINCHPDNARLWALTAQAGTPRWHRSFGQEWFSGIIGAADVVYVQVGEVVVGVRASDGAVATTVAGGVWWNGGRGLLVAGGMLYVADENGVVAYTTETAVPKPTPATLALDPDLVVPTVAPSVERAATPERVFVPFVAATAILVGMAVIALRLRARGRSAPRPPGRRGILPRSTPGSTATSGGTARRTPVP